MTKRPHRYSGGFYNREMLRIKLFDKQGGLCWLCMRPMTMRRNGGSKVPHDFATFDHVTPAANGGTAHRSNLKLAHRRCNSERGSRPVD